MQEMNARDSKIYWLWLAAIVTFSLLVYNYFSMWDMMSTVLLLIVVLVLGGFTLAEGQGDEREVYHRLLASRIGFLIGLGVLSLAAVYEIIINHRSATWLIYALTAMTGGKIIGLIWGRLKH